MRARGEVVKLDRKFPLVELEDGGRLRCEHATELVKREKVRAAIGDIVDVELPEGHDVGVITAIHPRRTTFIRRDPTERTTSQVLAANFDRVVIVQPAGAVNRARLVRELVLAHETGARVAVVLTKCDLVGGVGSDKALVSVTSVQALAGDDVDVIAISQDDADSIGVLRKLIDEGTSVLIGRSGVGKSTMINTLLGQNARATSEVRAADGKGRHTTVSREVMKLPGSSGRIVDMPGVRGLGLWDAEAGISSAFSDIESLAQECRFRDCAHSGEPGCAVEAAISEGRLSRERLESYQGLLAELADTNRRREQAGWKNR